MRRGRDVSARGHAPSRVELRVTVMRSSTRRRRPRAPGRVASSCASRWRPCRRDVADDVV